MAYKADLIPNPQNVCHYVLHCTILLSYRYEEKVEKVWEVAEKQVHCHIF